MNNIKPLAADRNSLRITRCGEVLGGIDLHNTHAWLGIPYAAPPIGELRWCAPRLPKSWRGQYAALQFQKRSLQRYLGAIFDDVAYIGSEDCLYLNIWSPQFQIDAIPTGDAKLPVMFYIPGGGNTFGGSDTVNPAKLAAAHRLIIVTLNYRLGVFGWLSHSSLHDNNSSPEERSGNYGTLDLIAALTWIQQNIANFGGDPGRVTVMGSSAGGTNTRCLLASPLAAGLFHRAIIQSSSMDLTSVAQAQNFSDDKNPGHPQSSNELLLQLLLTDGFAVDRLSAKKKLGDMNQQDVARYLRSKSLEQLENAYRHCTESVYGHIEQLHMTRLGMLGSAFSIPKPIGDGVVIPRGTFKEIFTRGDYNLVPVIMGTNRDEDKTFLSFDPRYIKITDPQEQSSDQETRFEIRDIGRYNLAAEYLGKMWKAAGVDELAVAMVKFQEQSIFTYRMDWDEQGFIDGNDISALKGAEHCIEERFIFGGEEYFQGPEHPPSSHVINSENSKNFAALSAALMSYWAEFAYSGKPDSGRDGTLPTWKAWTVNSGEDKLIIFDTPDDGGIRMSSYSINREEIFNEIASDPRLSNHQDRKNLFEDISNYFITRIAVDEYDRLVEYLDSNKTSGS